MKGHVNVFVVDNLSTCVIDSAEPRVAASLAVVLAVVHLPALEVVEQLARPAAPRMK